MSTMSREDQVELSVEADTIRVRLLDRAPLFDRPDCYAAGVREALSAMEAAAAEMFRADTDGRGLADPGARDATAGAVAHT